MTCYLNFEHESSNCVIELEECFRNKFEKCLCKYRIFEYLLHNINIFKFLYYYYQDRKTFFIYFFNLELIDNEIDDEIQISTG